MSEPVAVGNTSMSGRRGKLNYMVMTHPSLSPQPGIWGNLLGLWGRVVRIICVRVVSLTLVSFTHLILVCGSAVKGPAGTANAAPLYWKVYTALPHHFWRTCGVRAYVRNYNN